METTAQARDLDQVLRGIESLDLEPIKFRMTHKKIESRWSQERAELAALGYRRYLVLQAKYPGQPIPPTEDIDAFWHAHILDTRKYAEDCERVFGQFLHHYPYSGLRGAEDEAHHEAAAARMKKLYEEEFGEPLSLLGAWWTRDTGSSPVEVNAAACTRVAASWHAETNAGLAQLSATDDLPAHPRAMDLEHRKAMTAAFCG